jgi:hypothetical protein
MIKQKDMSIKINEDKLRALSDEATELNKEIY